MAANERVLQRLDTETWGERMARARRRAALTFRDVSTRISVFMPVSHSSIMRLEDLREAPTDYRRRAIATLTVMAYGFDPADFGLSLDELPAGWGRVRLKDLSDMGFRKRTCLAA